MAFEEEEERVKRTSRAREEGEGVGGGGGEVVQKGGTNRGIGETRGIEGRK